MQLVFQLTRDCNFACSYCYQAHRKGPAMAVATCEQALLRVLERGHAHVAVTWFGGEPLLARDVIERAQPRLEQLGRERGALVTAKVSTNGALLDASFCELARRHAVFVSLSTDGCPEAQDAGRPTAEGGPSSALVERALATLATTKAPFATYSVVTPRNVHLLARSVDWLFERGARMLVSTLDYGAAWTAADLRELERGYAALARRYVAWTRAGHSFYLAPFDAKISARTRPHEHATGRCAAGIRQLAVDPEGFFYPCIEFLESPVHRIGHVERGLDAEALLRWRRGQGGERPEECSGCGIRERCGSTCACLNLRTAGSLRGISELLCEHERLATLAADRIAQRLWRRKERGFLRRQYDPHHHALSALEGLFDRSSTR